MKRKQTVIFGIIAFAASYTVFMEACKKTDATIQHYTTPLSFTTPKGFPPPLYNFIANPLTKEGFELGKALFYDGKLSKDGNFPCASCHQQFAAFSTYEHDFSHGINNQFTTRNAPGLFNLAWYKEFQWDGGVNHLDLQPLAPITAPNEMGEDINNVLDKLRADAVYPTLFKAAFGSEEINSQRMLKAISQFTVMMVSSNSKYDKMIRGETTFNSFEQEGYNLFKAKCATCHKEPLFTDLNYRNNGLAVNTYLYDYGRMRITHNPQDSLKFKVPSLRNVELTYPYMHDGRFWTLTAVLDHYNTGIQNSPTLDTILSNNIPLTASEKTMVRYFLYTLTDSSLIKDARFEQPR